MEKVYNHKEVEEKWYSFWEKKGFFKADPTSKKPKYSLLIPPPNLTGELHLGHAMQHSILDALARYKRLSGYDVLLLPGVDHAGIQFESAFEKRLSKEGLSKHKLGREAWLKKAWEFKEEIYKSVSSTWRFMGLSADWDREVFTLDQGPADAVVEEFKTYFEKGLVYKGPYIVQWCPKDQTAIEDAEVEYEERKEKLYFLKYGPFTLATSRPETKFGDTAMAVHPDDKRYKEFIGKEFEIETLVGPKKMKVVADSVVDPEFGTGVIKVTPGHDFTDYEIGKRHDLPIIQVIDKTGRLTEVAGKYAGMKVMEAREAMLPELREKGILVKEEDYTHNVAVCERCKSVVEPIISEEWFVKVKDMAEEAVKTINNNEIDFLPKNYSKILTDWLENIHDWCISRSLWWGHRIPVWYKKARRWDLKIYDGEEIFHSLKNGTKRFETRAGKPDGSDKNWKEFKKGDILNFSLVEEGTENILSNEIVTKRIVSIHHFPSVESLLKKFDVKEIHPYQPENYVKWWESRPKFSERIKKFGIWAFELEDVEDRDEIYVGVEAPVGEGWVQDEQVLDTWFSSGLWPFSTLGWPKKTVELEKYFPWDFEITAPEIKYLWIARMIMLSKFFTHQIPFKQMFFHGMLRDLQGRKFSKSLGNGVDPNYLIDNWGVDATRMALYSYSIPGRDGKVSKQLLDERGKNFRNFETKLLNISRFILELKPGGTKKTKLEFKHEDDKWIKEELKATIKDVTTNINNVNLHLATDEIYNFVWHKLADVYLEKTKARRADAQPVLEYVLKEVLILLHPFMPFLTEEIWQKLPDKKPASIMVSSWPK